MNEYVGEVFSCKKGVKLRFPDFEDFIPIYAMNYKDIIFEASKELKKHVEFLKYSGKTLPKTSTESEIFASGSEAILLFRIKFSDKKRRKKKKSYKNFKKK